MALSISTFLLAVIVVYSSHFTDLSEADKCCSCKSYELHKANVTFAKAISLCNDMGAELATVLNEFENQAMEKVVLAALPKNEKSPVFNSWIAGIRCRDCDRNGKEFIWLPNGGKQVYKHFKVNQPDNLKGAQNCLVEVHFKELNLTAWDDVRCGNRHNYICQRRHHC